MPWIEAAEITSEVPEPEEAIKTELPDGYRAVCEVNGGPPYVEFYDEENDVAGWEEFAHVTAENWASEAAVDLAKSVGEGWRVVFDYNHSSTGAWLIERYHDGD